MKSWPGDLPAGMLGDLQAMFSSVTGRCEFTFHIRILGLIEVCAFSGGKFPFLAATAAQVVTMSLRPSVRLRPFFHSSRMLHVGSM